MDEAQLTRMIEWLDEERRRDKGMIAKLEERLQQQQELIEQLNRQLNGLEGQQASMKANFIPASRDTEMLDQLRSEMRQLIDEVETKRVATEREQDKRQTFARELMSQPM